MAFDDSTGRVLTPATRRLLRWAVLAVLLAAAFGRGPGPARAYHDEIIFDILGGDVYDAAGVALNVVAAADGTGAITGVVRFPGERGAAVFVAAKAPATASRADRDGDGVRGLTELTGVVREARGGASVPVVVTVIDPATDLDETGPYVLAFAVGDQRATIAVRVIVRTH